jgi:TRAP-type C4-dicarboxylate transport system permease small subunit
MLKIVNFVSKIIDILSLIVISTMTILVITAVFLRYCFNITFVQTEELISFLFIVIIFLGFVIVMREDEHVKVDYFIDKLPAWLNKPARVFVNLIIIVVNFFLFWISIKWIGRSGHVLSPGLRIPLGYIYIFVPFSAFFAIIYGFINIFKLIFDKKNNKEVKNI